MVFGSVNDCDNTALKEIEDTPGSAIYEANSSSFVSVEGRSDSFVSIRKDNTMDSITDVGEILFASKENGSTGYAVTRQNTYKSLQDVRSQSKVRKYHSLPEQQRHSRPKLSELPTFFSKRLTDVDEVLPNRGFNGKENIGSETCKTLYVRRRNVSLGEPNLRTDSTQCHLNTYDVDTDQSQYDESNIYENTEVCFNKEEQNGQCINESDNRRDSNNSNTSSLHSTQSSSSFSSRDSAASIRAYESPDESGHYANVSTKKLYFFLTRYTFPIVLNF